MYGANITGFRGANPAVRVTGEQYTGQGVSYDDKMRALVAAAEAADVRT